MSQAIQPGAAIKATWDMDRSRFTKKWQYALKDGVNVMNEATFLVREKGIDGGQVVLPCTGAANEIFAGVALHSGIMGYVWAQCLSATIPAVPNGAGLYQIDVGHKNLINDGGAPKTAYVKVAYAATGALFTINDAVTPPGGAGVVQVDPDTGIFTFNALDKNVKILITYRWVLSSIEHDFFVHDNHPNRGAELFLQEMMVGTGDKCVVYTMMYDAAADWKELSTAAGDQPCLAPNGEVTTVAINAVGTVIGRVVSVPTPDDPYLGIEFNA